VSLGNRAEWRATNLFLSANKKPNYYMNIKELQKLVLRACNVCEY
jgi:hypothetical protein